MDTMLQRAFELLITVAENGLFFCFIASRLAPKKKYVFYSAAGTFLLAAISTAIKSTAMPAHFSICLALALEILFTLLLTEGTLVEKLCWGCAFCVIDFFSESFTFLLFDIVTNYNSSTLLTEYPMRYISCTIYIVLLMAIVILLPHKSQNIVTFPRWILPIFIFLVILGIFAVETLLDVIIYLDSIHDYSQNHILYRAIWIFLFVFLFVILLIFYLNLLYRKNLKLAEEQKVRQIEIQQFELFSNTVQMLRVWKHDSKQHFSVMEELLHNEKYEDAISYIQNINQDFERTQFGIFTGNSVLDAVISTKQILIQKNEIQFSHSIFLPETLPFDQIALTSLMGNLFDNAIEACARLKDSTKRYMILTIKPHQNCLFIRMENSCDGEYHYDTGKHLRSRKTDPNHGIGLRRIQEISENVDGFCQIQLETDKFTVTIVVPLGTSTGR